MRFLGLKVEMTREYFCRNIEITKNVIILHFVQQILEIEKKAWKNIKSSSEYNVKYTANTKAC